MDNITEKTKISTYVIYNVYINDLFFPTVFFCQLMVNLCIVVKEIESKKSYGCLNACYCFRYMYVFLDCFSSNHKL